MMRERRQELTHLLLLIVASAIWGAAFVAQSIGAEHVGPLAFLSIRSWLAFFFLIPVIVLIERRKKNKDTSIAYEKAAASATWINAFIGGLLCGFFLFTASLFQQIGIPYTTTAKAGFITALYVVMVPMLSLASGLRSTWKIWVCMLLSVLGLYLLCMTGGSRFGPGDLLMLLCALTFSFQIMSVNYFVRRTDGILLAESQFLVEAILATVFMFIFEKPAWESVAAAAPALLYTGLMSSGIGYTLQIIGQDGVNPAVASLAMSLESVFSAVAGWLILGQSMKAREILGCFIMFSAIVLSQLSIGNCEEPAEKENYVRNER